MEKKINALMINKADNVIIALNELKKGDSVQFRVDGQLHELEVTTDVPIYHKIAFFDIKKDEYIFKYGENIGVCTQNIQKGEHVSVHNLISIREYV